MKHIAGIVEWLIITVAALALVGLCFVFGAALASKGGGEERVYRVGMACPCKCGCSRCPCVDEIWELK